MEELICEELQMRLEYGKSSPMEELICEELQMRLEYERSSPTGAVLCKYREKEPRARAIDLKGRKNERMKKVMRTSRIRRTLIIGITHLIYHSPQTEQSTETT